MKRITVAAILAASLLTGCASITEGTSQSMTIASDPAGATCQVVRDGGQVGSIARTPGSIHIDKSKKDITVTCSKDGFETTSVSYTPSFNDATFGNVILGGGVGAIVDASTGANYNYPNQVTVTLTKPGS